MTVCAHRGLTFKALREANRERRKITRYQRCETQWTTAHWLQALVGELGELANNLKKIDRGDYYNADADQIAELRGQIADELGDVQTYLDILADVLEVDLGEATIHKFNVVSERVGSQVHFSKDGTPILTRDTR